MTQRERQVLQLIESDPLISQQDIAKKLGITRSSVAVHISNLTKKGCIAGRGYVLRSGSYAVVVGGVNVDIGGRSFAPLVAADSNPGTVSISLGGVGRNIAHNLALLGADVHLLSAYGDDVNGERVAASCSELGIDLSHALRVAGGTTSTYLYLTDEHGEMALAVSDRKSAKNPPRLTWRLSFRLRKTPRWWWPTPIFQRRACNIWRITAPCPCSLTRFPPSRPKRLPPSSAKFTPSSPTAWKRSCCPV